MMVLTQYTYTTYILLYRLNQDFLKCLMNQVKQNQQYQVLHSQSLQRYRLYIAFCF